MTTSNKWSGWLAFPDPEEDGYLFAPFGPGVYELHNRQTRELVLFGSGKNLAYRMSSLLPAPFGAGNRNNTDKREYVLTHLASIEYRTKACMSKKGAVNKERTLCNKNSYIFKLEMRGISACRLETMRRDQCQK